MTSLAEREPEVAADASDELAVFRKQDAIVAELREKYMGLTIKGVDDKKGFDAVHSARMVVKAARVDCEKTRVRLKADALERGRKIDAEAKRVAAMLAPIEEHLEAEENSVVKERERIKAEAEATRKAIIKQRFDALQSAGYTGDMMIVPELDNEKFEALLAVAQEDKAERDRLAALERERAAAEQERLRRLEAEQAEARRKADAEAEAKRKAEEAALAKERERLAEERRKQEEEAARLRSEQERIAAEQRKIELERAKQEAAERARKETEERLAREAAEKKASEERKAAQERAEAEAAEAARIKAEQERPHREKILAIADTIDAMKAPEGPKHDAVALALSECANRIRGIANGKLSKP